MKDYFFLGLSIFLLFMALLRFWEGNSLLATFEVAVAGLGIAQFVYSRWKSNK